jgi:glycosyltransferase involved in cell wall biosynthesis
VIDALRARLSGVRFSPRHVCRARALQDPQQLPITVAMDASPFWRDPADRRALARARGAIGEHRAAFDLLVAGALHADDPLEAAAIARMAFTYGMFNHPGVLASAPLEQLLHALGREHVPGVAGRSPAAHGRVLHVATVVYETGGHGRVLERWLARDAARTPTVLLLKEDEPVPASLTRAVSSAGGTFAPALGVGDLFERARALRALAAEHELVVLHVSNHEVVVPLAFADDVGRPPTILCNHASHQLWTGVGCADVVANLNDFDAAESVARRGVASQRSLVLRAPAAPRTLPGRAEARAQLGLDPAAPVVLTIASPYKLRALLAPAYRDLAAAVLDAVPAATLLLVGPRPEDCVVPEHPRIRVLGPLADIGPQLAAADLLLDSWPVTGGTTVLDAGAAGVPVLALGDPPPAMVGAPHDLLDGAIARAPDVASLGARAAALLADPQERARLAAHASAVVAARHGNGWAAEMEALVAAARAHAGQAAPPVVPSPAAGPDAPAAGAAPSSAAGLDAPAAGAAPPAAPPPAAPSDWEAVIQLVRDGHEQTCTLEQAFLWNAPDLPPDRRPRTGADLAERLGRLRAPAARRAIAAPAVDAGAIGAAIEEARRLVRAGTIGGCALVVAPERVDEAVAHVEAALAAGEDLDVELLTGADAAALAAPGDVLLG